MYATRSDLIMPKIRGRMRYHGFNSPAPPKGAPKEVKVFMARTYGGLREKRFPGESKQNKMRASKITWYQTKRKFGEKYPELFEHNNKSVSRIPRGLKGREKQIERGTRIEYREHPEFGKKGARSIAIDHLKLDKSEYLPGNKNLSPSDNSKTCRQMKQNCHCNQNRMYKQNTKNEHYKHSDMRKERIEAIEGR